MDSREDSIANGSDGSDNSDGYSNIFTVFGSSDGSYDSITTESVDGRSFRHVDDVPNLGFVPDSGNSGSFDNISHTMIMKKIITVVVVCLGIVSALTFGLYYKHIFGGSDLLNDSKYTPALLTPDKCEKDISTTTVGKRICIPYTQKFTGYPSVIHVRQLSSQYLSAHQEFSVNVLSDTFVQNNGDWIINFNSSRTDQQFRFVLENATCDSIGIYEITIKYGDGNVTSFEFEIVLEEPKLKHSVNRINNSIHVHCEMTNTCQTSSIALIINNEESSRLIPDINDCSNHDKKSSSTISADAIIPVSRFSENQTISCVPFMTDPKLAANLTSTTGIPVCEGADCVPNCKDDPHGIAYFRDKHICNIFYQCSNGDMISQTCSPSTYWSHSECTCVHFNDGICDPKTYRFFQPVMSFEKCTNAPLF